MVRFSRGLFGGITGALGDVEGYVRNGIACVRVKKRKSKLPPSLKQLTQQQKMSVINRNRFYDTTKDMQGKEIQYAQKRRQNLI